MFLFIFISVFFSNKSGNFCLILETCSTHPCIGVTLTKEVHCFEYQHSCYRIWGRLWFGMHKRLYLHALKFQTLVTLLYFQVLYNPEI
ncbi:hypothetical protein KC19_2G271300 [Ceratodon purpureus]|uniref:Secreted protein n=1 Tax=Ceratodon purpureus TaxID=3225 RepID=A0A8T0J1D4_CERPU|nr:hypothetical protein KC19_2G271300 [Ceratodon purpureus]